MPKITGEDKILSAIAKGRSGPAWGFGRSQFGGVRFGQQDIFLIKTGYGDSTYGVDDYANIILLSGVYRQRKYPGETRAYREPHYIPYNPRTETQQANRQKMTDGVLAWQGLPDPEKKLWRIKAVGEKMTGFNLFLSDYLLTH